jgi:uncharacterized membrane protein YgdD (TMEM256/DUF423 family)
MCEPSGMNSAASAHRLPLIAAGLSGLTGVGLGALGAHALAAALAERGMSHAWQTAAHYQLVHTLALLGVGVWLRVDTGAATALLGWAVRLWIGGIILFSGSLYLLAAGGPRWLGPVTPLGGIAFMAGWLLVALAGRKRAA